MEDEKAPSGDLSPPLPSPPPPPPPPFTTSPALSPSPPDAETPTDSVSAFSSDLGERLPFGGDDALPTALPPPPPNASPTAAGPEEPPHEEAPAAATPDGPTDELRMKIVRQVEYYFSDENLPTDNFLLKHIKKNKEGFVPIPLIASFRKMKKLVQDISLIESALRTSSKLVVSSDGKKVKRLHPLPAIDKEEAKLRTVLVKNLPENCSNDYIQEKFGTVGNIKRISLQGQPQKADGAEISRERAFIGRKMHAFVEYETVEAAKNAVTNLNDESDWRTGLRVEPLVKQVGKHGQALKGKKGAFLENHNANDALNTAGEESDMKSSDQPIETVEYEEKHALQVKSEVKIQSRRRGRTQQQYRVEGYGRGGVLFGPRIESMNRPVSGPRMPDGTRGFTMGRGKPIAQDQKDG